MKVNSYVPDFNEQSSRSGSVDIKIVSRSMGLLMYFEAALMLLSTGVSLVYGDGDLSSLLVAVGVCIAVGLAMSAYGRHAHEQPGRRESYIVVGLTWILFSAFGMIPFVYGGYIPSVTDAFFETMSGFTTTGATILDDIESLPHGILFWRTLTQWIGGLGIVFFTIALLPGFGRSSQMLFLSESTGVTHTKIHPNVRVMARFLWLVYFTLTLSETVLLMLGGMNLFDAVCHAFATTATGGFSTKSASIAYWNSPFIEYVVSLFMILSGINFTLYFYAMKGQPIHFLREREVRWFLKSVGVLTVVITVTLMVCNGYDIEEAFRKSLFQVATCHTSCGFASADYTLWPGFVWMLLIFAMLSGGCTGSTSGGIKNMRLMIMSQGIRNQVKQILHPQAVLPVRINGKIIDHSIINAVQVFFVSYMAFILIGWVLLMLCGVGLTESMSTVISAMGNVGPGLGAFGPENSWAAMPSVAKWILSALMLIGRLEIFGLLIAFYPGTWDRNLE